MTERYERRLSRRVALAIATLALALCVRTAAASEYDGDPEAARPFDQQARDAYQAENFAEAARLFEQAYEAYHHPEFIFNAGQSFRRAGQYDRAAAAYRRHVQESGEAAPIAYFNIGDCLRQGDGDLIESIRAYQEYLNHDLTSDLAAHARIAIATGLPYERHNTQDVEQVREAYDRAMELYREPGQERQAAESLVQSAERLHIGEFLYDASGIYQIEQMWTEAARTYQRYLETPNPRPGAWVDMAECLLMSGDDAGARRAAQHYMGIMNRGPRWEDASEIVQATVVGEDPPSADDRRRAAEAFQRATLHYRRGEVDEALREFRAAYQLSRDRAAQFNVGMCLTSARNWAEAARHWTEYAGGGRFDRDAVAHLFAAQAYLGQGNTDEARHHLQAYIDRADERDLPNEAADRRWAEGMLRDAGRAAATDE